MKIRRLQKIRLKDPLYQTDIMLLHGGDMKTLRRFLDRRHGQGCKTYNKENVQAGEMGGDDDNDGLQFHVNDTPETFYIWLSAPSVDLLWHEIYHLTHDILHTRGIAYSDSAEDAYAYFGAALFEQAYQRLFARSQ